MQRKIAISHFLEFLQWWHHHFCFYKIIKEQNTVNFSHLFCALIITTCFHIVCTSAQTISLPVDFSLIVYYTAISYKIHRKYKFLFFHFHIFSELCCIYTYCLMLQLLVAPQKNHSLPSLITTQERNNKNNRFYIRRKPSSLCLQKKNYILYTHISLCSPLFKHHFVFYDLLNVAWMIRVAYKSCTQ